jgi:hypothetical protein
MKTEKSEWIEQIINSGMKLSGLQAPEYLQQRILEVLDKRGFQSDQLAFLQFRRIVAAAIVLLVMNTAVLVYSSISTPKPVQSAYSLDSYNLSLY